MIVITLTSCPPKLRGDLSKWLCEINTGVYVGNLSARVRDRLWLRVCENLDNGKATMVYSSNNEQHLEFRVHNGDWSAVDFDGITLMKRPLTRVAEKGGETTYHSKAGNWYRGAAMRKAKVTAEIVEKGQSAAEEKLEISGRAERSEERNQPKDQSSQKITREQSKITNKIQSIYEYVVIDIETTGLRAAEDEIIELAAIKIVDGIETDSFSCLIAAEERVPETITKLTGITQKMLDSQGKELKSSLKAFLDFIGKNKIICHNLSFDIIFLQKACRKCGYPTIMNSSEDTVKTARKKLDDVSDYKLTTLASYFGLERQKHRALDDCRLLFQVYEKLLKISDG